MTPITSSRLAIASCLAVLALASCSNGFEYDEEAHQRVIEAYGVDVVDWELYRDTIETTCALDEEAFEAFVRAEKDLGRYQLDIAYTCPDRMDEFAEITGFAPLD